MFGQARRKKNVTKIKKINVKKQAKKERFFLPFQILCSVYRGGALCNHDATESSLIGKNQTNRKDTLLSNKNKFVMKIAF